ncbi:hypothetical protein [Candidatus Magnetobacterium casense]|uniref:Uncharacterized protein n=1 Tax=Candidatus Magnetobacterium casense TaxID=1455061 RepID=A0ABS6RZ07_9BACT|nr:hypothetical protein [Candidatus Magnetobacterium casensis]MBV6341882.1 hypothetical protein [Candidatus Magnetobacterium casensis]
MPLKTVSHKGIYPYSDFCRYRQSPVIDIVFSSIIAGIVVYLVSKKQNRLYTQLERTYNDREQALFNIEREVLWCSV